MRRLIFSLLLCTVAASPALACGKNTVAWIEHVMVSDTRPLFLCGSEFNEMLARVQKKDWKGALAAYKAHLANVGRWEAGSADAIEALAYLERKAQAR
jgi:hypothetical protein